MQKNLTNMNSENLLHHAAAAGDTSTVLNFIRAGADPNERDQHGRTALYYAVSKGHSSLVGELLKEGAKPAASEMEVALWENLERGPGIRRPGDKREKNMSTLSVIGEPGAGKSHFATLLYIHLRTHEDINVQVDFEDAYWNIINHASRLGRGLPLEPTPRDLAVSNVLTVSYKRSLIGSITPRKSLRIPVLDSSGEILQLAMDEVLSHRGGFSEMDLRAAIEKQGYEPGRVRDLYNNVFRATGFCFVVDAQQEFRDPGNSVEHRHAVFLQNLANYRARVELEPFQNSMLVLTKYDAVQDAVEDKLIDLGPITSETVGNYLCPNLLNQLRGPNDRNPVRVILSDTEWEEPPKTEEEIRAEGDNLDPRKEAALREGRFQTKVTKDGSPVPVYSQAEYEEAVNWIKSLI